MWLVANDAMMFKEGITYDDPAEVPPRGRGRERIHTW